MNIRFKNVNAEPKAKSMYSKRAGDLDNMYTLLQYQAKTPSTTGK